MQCVSVDDVYCPHYNNTRVFWLLNWLTIYSLILTKLNILIKYTQQHKYMISTETWQRYIYNICTCICSLYVQHVQYVQYVQYDGKVFDTEYRQIL